MILGAQLYTVRAFTQDLESFAETLAKVADIGYTSVQVSGTGAFEPEWLKEQLDKNGLVCPITHSKFEKMEENPKKVVDEHNVFGCKGIGIGGMPDTYDNFLKSGKKTAQAIASFGSKLCYHNHFWEFVKLRDNKTMLQCMKEDFTPDELSFTFDTFWAQVGGADPAQYIRDFAGRIDYLHYKDFVIKDKERKMAAIGEGNMNYDAILEASVQSGAKYAFVELDDCYGADPFDALKRSYNNLKAKGYK